MLRKTCEHAYIYRLGIIQVLFQPSKHCHVTTSLRVGYLIAFSVTHHSGAFHLLIGVLAGILELHDITQHAGNTMIDLNTRVSAVNASKKMRMNTRKSQSLNTLLQSLYAGRCFSMSALEYASKRLLLGGFLDSSYTCRISAATQAWSTRATGMYSYGCV